MGFFDRRITISAIGPFRGLAVVFCLISPSVASADSKPDCPTPAVSLVDPKLIHDVSDATTRAKILAGMKDQGFKCQDLSPSAGLECIGRIPAYPREVALLIPSKFRPSDQADTVLFLHGNNDQNFGLSHYTRDERLGESLTQSGRNAIMIVPLSLPGNVKAAGKQTFTADAENTLGTADGYTSFFKGIGSVFQGASLSTQNEVRSIVIASHSGGYRTAGAIIQHGALAEKTHELYLLDSAYGHEDEFVSFANTPGHRLWSVYTPHLAAGNSCIMERLDQAKVPHFGCAEFQQSCGNSAPPVNADCTRAPASDGVAVFSAVGSNNVGFVPTTSTHEDLVAGFLGTFLSKGAAPELPRGTPPVAGKP